MRKFTTTIEMIDNDDDHGWEQKLLAPRMLIPIVSIEINNTTNATIFASETGAKTSITTFDMDSIVLSPSRYNVDIMISSQTLPADKTYPGWWCPRFLPGLWWHHWMYVTITAEGKDGIVVAIPIVSDGNMA